MDARFKHIKARHGSHVDEDKRMHMENLLEILEKAPLEEGHSAAVLAADLYKEIAPHLGVLRPVGGD